MPYTIIIPPKCYQSCSCLLFILFNVLMFNRYILLYRLIVYNYLLTIIFKFYFISVKCLSVTIYEINMKRAKRMLDAATTTATLVSIH